MACGTDCNDIKRPSVNAELVDAVREVLYNNRSVYELPIYSRYTVKGLDLLPSTVGKICYSNYIRFVGEEPKRVNDGLFLSVAEEMYRDLKDIPEYEKSVAWLRKFI